MAFQSRRSKVSGPSGPPLKKDGYAKGPVPKAMLGSKPGKIPGQGYSGPNVAKPSSH